MSTPLNGGSGLAGKSGRKTATACDANPSEMIAATIAHFMLVIFIFLNFLSTDVLREIRREVMRKNAEGRA
jgi:hypothetical protein